jgi:hypothetical protein
MLVFHIVWLLLQLLSAFRIVSLIIFILITMILGEPTTTSDCHSSQCISRCLTVRVFEFGSGKRITTMILGRIIADSLSMSLVWLHNQCNCIVTIAWDYDYRVSTTVHLFHLFFANFPFHVDCTTNNTIRSR